MPSKAKGSWAVESTVIPPTAIYAQLPDGSLEIVQLDINGKVITSGSGGGGAGGDVTQSDQTQLKTTAYQGGSWSGVGVTGTFWPYTLGQQLASASVPVVLPASQVTTLTPPSNTGYSTSSNQTSVQSTPGTPQTTAITVQGNASGVALPISASSFPLPTGAATSANQPGFGTAGTPSANVSSVQGVASGTPIPVTGNVASGATDSGNPIKAGGKYNAALPTLADGQRGDLQLDANGRLIVYIGTLGAGEDIPNNILNIYSKPFLATYSASITELAIAAAATDFFEIKGSASKTVRIIRIQISGIATAAGASSVQALVRSTANTSGTSTVPTVVPHDSGDAAATATLKAYTANPTTGTLTGVVRSIRPTFTTAAGSVPEVPVVLEFGREGSKGIVLRGTGQSLCLNLNGATVAGLTVNVDVTWVEDGS